MTPLEINVLLECYYSGKPGRNVLPNIWNSAACGITLCSFINRGLIDKTTLKTTAKGEELVQKLLAVALT